MAPRFVDFLDEPTHYQLMKMQTSSHIDPAGNRSGGSGPLILHPWTSFCTFVPGERESGQGGPMSLASSDVPFPKPQPRVQRQRWPPGLPPCETSRGKAVPLGFSFLQHLFLQREHI